MNVLSKRIGVMVASAAVAFGLAAVVGTGGVGGDRRDRVDDGDRRDRPAVVVVVQAGPHGPELALGRRPPRWPLGRAGVEPAAAPLGVAAPVARQPLLRTGAHRRAAAPVRRAAATVRRTAREPAGTGAPPTLKARPVGPPRGALESSTRRRSSSRGRISARRRRRSGAVSGSLACSSRSAVAAGSSTIGTCPHPRNRTQRVCSGSWSRRRATPGSSTRSRVPNATVTGTVIAAPPLNRSFSRARSVSRNPGAAAMAWTASRAGS